MGNDFRQISEDKLSLAGLSAARTLQESTEYPIDAARVQALANAATDYRASLRAAREAHHAARAATRLKDAAGETLIRALNGIAADLYPDPAVSDALIVGLGFAPRPSRDSRAKGARPVTGLRASPAVDGSLRLVWDRSGNSRTTAFVVFAHAEGEGWRMVGTTVRTRITLEGFVPGVTAWLRVVASNSTGQAPPSPTVSIYLGVAREAARRAA